LRDGVDFLVPSHWGKMYMRVQKSGASAPVRLNKDKDYKQYGDLSDPKSPDDQLLYRLDPVPGPTERDPSTSGVSMAHLTKAQKIFREIYEFLASEFTHRSPFVGPYMDPDTSTAAEIEISNFAKKEDDDGVAAIGTVTGNLFHPDVPKSHKGKSGREAHFNHFHVQIGTIKMGPTVP
jgi:hypothetical protein